MGPQQRLLHVIREALVLQGGVLAEAHLEEAQAGVPRKAPKEGAQVLPEEAGPNLHIRVLAGVRRERAAALGEGALVPEKGVAVPRKEVVVLPPERGLPQGVEAGVQGGAGQRALVDTVNLLLVMC